MGQRVAAEVAVSTTVGRMRLSVLVLALVGLAVSASACSAGGAGTDDVPARDREQQAVDLVNEALPVVRDAMGATSAEAAGGWSSCPGGVGHVYSGGGTVVVEKGDPAALAQAAKAALDEAGFDDVSADGGFVGVTRDEVELSLQPSPARGPGAWKVSFTGPCKRYGGDDEQYVQDQNLEGERALLP